MILIQKSYLKCFSVNSSKRYSIILPTEYIDFFRKRVSTSCKVAFPLTDNDYNNNNNNKSDNNNDDKNDLIIILNL